MIDGMQNCFVLSGNRISLTQLEIAVLLNHINGIWFLNLSVLLDPPSFRFASLLLA
jgi:hypothetical protein